MLPLPRLTSALAPRAALVLAVVLSGCASPAQRGPEGGSILALLNTDGREIRLGDEVQGALSSSDFVSVDGNYLEAWRFQGEPGQIAHIDLISDDFDAFLYVVGPGLDQPLQDDDGGGACHARVELRVLDEGDFHVVASSRSWEASGTYTLRMSESASPPARISCGGIDGGALRALPTDGRELRLGDTAYGQMTGSEPSVENRRPVQAWTLEGEPGETVAITLRSEDFDAYLYVTGVEMAEAMTDDDSAGNLDSEITATFGASGRLTVGAAALSPGATGSYSVTVTRPVQLTDLETSGRALTVGRDAYGSISDLDTRIGGRPVQAWAIEGRAGQSVVIDLVSDDFDSYLQLVGPGIPSPLTDDDGAGDLNSRLTVTFPQNGTYRVIAGPLSSGTGAYTLRVR